MTNYIDLSYLEELSEGNSEFLKDMISTFLERVPLYKQDFLEFRNQKDWSKMQSLAHKSKTTFMMMGVPYLSEQAALIEQYCKEGNKENEIEQALNKIVPYFKSVVVEMQSLYSKL